MSASYFKGAVLFGASAALLAACGGGGGGGGSTGPVELSTGTEPVLATGSDDFAASTVDFPYYFADTDLDRDVVRGVAAVRVIDSDTLELEDPESGTTFRLVLQEGSITNGVFGLFVAGPDEELGTEDDVYVNSDWEIIDLAGTGEYFSFNLLNDVVDDNGPIRERVGGFGYETADMPGGFFEYDGVAYLYLVDDAPEPDDPYYEAYEGSFFMFANLNDNTFGGNAFEASINIALDEDAVENDILVLEIGMDGTIEGNKLTGSVSGETFSVRVDGGDDVLEFSLGLTNGDLDGQFFGENAGVVNGTWGADVSLSGFGESATGEAVGFFEGEGRSVEP